MVSILIWLSFSVAMLNDQRLAIPNFRNCSDWWISTGHQIGDFSAQMGRIWDDFWRKSDEQTLDTFWLVVWNIFYFSIYWECHHPIWRTHIFQRGRAKNHQPAFVFFFDPKSCSGTFHGHSGVPLGSLGGSDLRMVGWGTPVGEFNASPTASSKYLPSCSMGIWGPTSKKQPRKSPSFVAFDIQENHASLPKG